MALKLITAPTTLPVTLAEAKLHLRVDHSDEDDKITRAIQGATDFAEGPEGFLGRALIDQTWDLVIDEFPLNEIRIPLPPLIEVVSVKYDDPGGSEQTISPLDYTVDDASLYGWVVPTAPGAWPSTFDGINSVRIRFRAGYVDLSDSPPIGEVPSDIINALLLWVGDLYENRQISVIGQTVQQMPNAHSLLMRRRADLSMA